MANGFPITVTFTPGADCDVILTAAFTAQTVGSDWGANEIVALRLTQSGTTTYSADQPLANDKHAYAMTHIFSAVAGASVSCGLYGEVSGASSESLFDLQLSVFVRNLPP